MSANPEIKLPPDPVDEENEHGSPGIDEAENEKKPPSRSSTPVTSPEEINSDSEIVRHYLTFETDLPAPAYLSSPDISHQSQEPPPPCPDLKKYINPVDWPAKQKRILILMSVITTMLSAFTAGSYSSGEDQMAEEWNVSVVAVSVGITVFTVGFGVAPMALAPFSEINGRRPMFVVTGVLFVAMQISCALTPTYAGMIVSRFLVGCAGSTFSTMVGGVVSDIYSAKDRNTPMALFSGAALFGTGLGPLVCGFIAQNTTWRWIFYLQIIMDGVMMIFIIAFFSETRGSVLLSRKANTLNKWYSDLESHGYYGMLMPTTTTTTTTTSPTKPHRPQRIRWKVKSDEERASLRKMITISLYRPFHLLVTEPVVFFFSLWISFAWAILYLTFSAVPLIFTTNHAFTLQQADAVFAAISIASVLSTILSIHQESLARRYLSPSRRAFLDSPEGRLYFSCIQSVLLPIGCFWLAWSQFPAIPWIVPALAVGCATMGIFSIYLAVFNYLADTYHKYASSALAAQSFCRNMLAGAFPLFTRQMFTGMTFQGAGSFLGGVAAVLTLVPWVLVFYGPRIRARSQFASEIMGEK